MAEKHIFQSRQHQGLRNKSFNVYTLREEVKYAFNTGFKDSYALFQKLPEIVTDFKKAFIINEERLRLPIIADNSRILHRKVVNFNNDHTFIIYVKCDSISVVNQYFKVVIFEQATGYEETFQFETAMIFTKDELQSLNTHLKANNEKGVREVFLKVVEKRLKIKMMGEDL